MEMVYKRKSPVDFPSGFFNERRRRDSNPRYSFEYAGFQDRCIKPALPLLRMIGSNHPFGLSECKSKAYF